MICRPYKEAQLYQVSQGFHSNHLAVDFGYKYGTFLVAPENCTITKIITHETPDIDMSELNRGFGIVMKTTSGGYHTYWHCNPAFPVKVGDIVYQGQPVAQMGNSGFVLTGGKVVPIEDRNKPPFLGTHLHWDMMVGQTLVDPLKYIDWSIPIKYDLITTIMAVVNNMRIMVKSIFG